MTALESQIRKIIVEYGYVKRLKEYPFPCLVIPKPVMDTLCERLARVVYTWTPHTEPVTTDDKKGRIDP